MYKRQNSNNARVANVKALHKLINSTSSVLSVNEFTGLLKKADIAFGSVNSVATLANHVGLNLVKVKTSKGDEVQIAAPPINRTIDTRNGLPPPPKLGEHTTKVFKEFGFKAFFDSGPVSVF